MAISLLCVTGIFPIYKMFCIPFCLGTKVKRCYRKGSCGFRLGTPLMHYECVYSKIPYCYHSLAAENTEQGIIIGF